MCTQAAQKASSYLVLPVEEVMLEGIVQGRDDVGKEKSGRNGMK